MITFFFFSIVGSQIGLVDEWFSVKQTSEREDEEEEIVRLMEKGAQDLVNHYVRMQGNIISQVSDYFWSTKW